MFHRMPKNKMDEWGCRVQVWPWSFLNLHHMSTVDSLWRKSPYSTDLRCTRSGRLCLSPQKTSRLAPCSQHPPEPTHASFVVATCCLDEDKDGQIGDRIIVGKQWWREFYMSLDFHSAFLGAKKPKLNLSLIVFFLWYTKICNISVFSLGQSNPKEKMEWRAGKWVLVG